MIAHGRGHDDALSRHQGGDPVDSPYALGGVVDTGQGLQGHGGSLGVEQHPAQIVEEAAHTEDRGADRAAEIKGDDARAGVASKLQGQHRQEHALARAGRAHHQGVTDIADVQRQPKRR